MAEAGRTPIIRRRTTFKVGLVVGAIAMYLLDPERGAERRSRLRDRIVAAPRVVAQFVDEFRDAAEQMREQLPGDGAVDQQHGLRASDAGAATGLSSAARETAGLS